MANVALKVINNRVLTLSLNGSNSQKNRPILVFVRCFLKCHFDALQCP